MNRRHNWSFYLIVGALILVTGVGWIHSEGKARLHLGEADFFQEALLQSGAAIVALNEHGKIIKWSDGATEIFGWSRAQALGYGIAFILPADMREAHRQGFDAFVLSGSLRSVHEIRCAALTKKGERVNVAIQVRSFQRNGHRVIVAIIDRDDLVNRVKVSEGDFYSPSESVQ